MQAEEAFTQANILDHLNPRPWGMITILCLTASANGAPISRVAQANYCFREALRLGLKDENILEEAGDLYLEFDQKNATLCYSELVKAHPSNGQGWQKLGDILGNSEGLTDSDRDRAIEAYKQAIDLLDGEGNKQKNALAL